MRKSSLDFRMLGYALGVQLFCFVSACPQSAYAYVGGGNGHSPHQVSTAAPITGRVLDAQGNPVQGVTVVVKGTKKATTTDISGSFTIDAAKGDVLVISSVGFKSQDVKVGDGPISVALVAGDAELSTVVVTALGIKKQARSLGYSTTQVDGSKFTEARETNIGNALTGQVAGVNVAGTATGPSGSSRVVIRGNSSLTQNAMPLYVIDGVPFDNKNQGSAGQYGGLDLGDGLSTINPDDIESIQVLKGVAASALYGYRGGNGAILITTKSGNKGLGLTINDNITVSNVVNTTDYQYQYGQGSQGTIPRDATGAAATEYYSWGEKFKDTLGTNFLGQTYKYSPIGKDNIKNFYKSGPVNQLSAALTGSNDKGHFRLGLSDLYNGTPIPNSNMKQQVINFNSVYNVLPKLQLNLTANYAFEQVKNRVSFSDAPGNVVAGPLYLANSFDIRWLKPAVNAANTELLPGQDQYFNNPYFVAYKFQNSTSRNRLTGSITLKYNIFDWLYAQAGASRDGYIFDVNEVVPTGTGYDMGGQITVNKVDFHELNGSYLIGVNKKFGSDFSFNANAGGNYQDDVTSQGGVIGAGPFLSPYVYTLANVANRPYSFDYQHTRVNSLYGSADIGYKNFLFLSGTVREDWFSTLNINNNHRLYPSVSSSFVFSDAFKLPDWISFGKLRASYAGGSSGALSPYLNTQTYATTTYNINGQPLGYVLQNAIPNPNLVPVKIEEEEVGLNMDFLGGRAGFDVAYYHKMTIHDIVTYTVSEGTGYGTGVANLGKLRNQGIEVLLTGTPLKMKDFSWNTSFNISVNNNKVLATDEVGNPIVVAGANARWGNGVNISHVLGLPFAQIMGFGYKKDAHGNRIISDGSSASMPPAGEPLPTDKEIPLGSGVYKTTGGFSNDFHYKGFTLSALIDFKYGAKIYSGSNLLMYTYGLSKTTLQGRETGGYVAKGVTPDGKANTLAVNSQTYFTDLSTASDRIAEEFVYDASFIKLRSLSIGYSLPASMLKGTVIKGLSFSLVCRNVATLMKHTPNIDPESNYTNTGGQGLELSGYPLIRTMGANLNLKF